MRRHRLGRSRFGATTDFAGVANRPEATPRVVGPANGSSPPACGAMRKSRARRSAWPSSPSPAPSFLRAVTRATTACERSRLPLASNVAGLVRFGQRRPRGGGMAMVAVWRAPLASAAMLALAAPALAASPALTLPGGLVGAVCGVADHSPQPPDLKRNVGWHLAGRRPQRLARSRPGCSSLAFLPRCPSSGASAGHGTGGPGRGWPSDRAKAADARPAGRAPASCPAQQPRRTGRRHAPAARKRAVRGCGRGAPERPPAGSGPSPAGRRAAATWPLNDRASPRLGRAGQDGMPRQPVGARRTQPSWTAITADGRRNDGVTMTRGRDARDWLTEVARRRAERHCCCGRNADGVAWTARTTRTR